MDPSLHLLVKLQRRGRFRRWRKTLATPKGIVFAVISGLLLAWFLGSAAFAVTIGGVKAAPESVRRQGPVILLGLTLLTLGIGNGGRALYFTPAEEAFLFAGPYRRRQLLAYKLRAVFVGSALSAVFLLAATTMSWTSPVAAYVGLVLIGVFLELASVVFGLAGGVVGALAWGRARRGVLIAMIAAFAWAARSSMGDLSGLSWPGILAGVARSPLVGIIATPFRVFIEAFASERAWPDLLPWAAGAAAIDLALVALVFALDAGYLEVASASSARTYAKLQKMRAGGGVRAVSAGGEGRSLVGLPGPAWWGGIGPNFWRQMTAALGAPGRLVFLALFMGSPLVGIAGAGAEWRGIGAIGPSLGMFAWVALLLGGLVPYDFRADLDQMEVLKALPIPPTRLALGQLLAPVLLVTLAQAVVLAALLATTGAGRQFPLAWSALAFLAPANLLLVAVDNLLFLWSPSRPAAGQLDVAMMGRMALALLAKLLAVALVAMASSGAGAAIYLLAGRNLPAALAAGWLVLASSALAMVPWVGRAFAGYDVAGDTPA